MHEREPLTALRPPTDQLSGRVDPTSVVGWVKDILTDNKWIVVERLFPYEPVVGGILAIRNSELVIITEARLLDGWTKHFLVLEVDNTDGIRIGQEVVIPDSEDPE
jgi:hypothetical protein